MITALNILPLPPFWLPVEEEAVVYGGGLGWALLPYTTSLWIGKEAGIY